MKKNLTFDRIVGLADGLPLLQKETLIEILSRRLIADRRDDLRNDIQAASREFKAGKCRAVTAAKLMKEIAG